MNECTLPINEDKRTMKEGECTLPIKEDRWTMKQCTLPHEMSLDLASDSRQAPVGTCGRNN